MIIFAALAAGTLLALRMVAGKTGPALRQRCSDLCDLFLDNMPESFPPNGMMADLQALKEQTALILEKLEEPEHSDGTDLKS